MKRKAVTVTSAAIQAAARQNTKASARLEGRELPADFVRWPAVERYIAECGSRTADTSVPRREPDHRGAPTGSTGSGIGGQADDVLSILRTEIWLLEDRSPITKADREQMLDDPPGD